MSYNSNKPKAFEMQEGMIEKHEVKDLIIIIQEHHFENEAAILCCCVSTGLCQ